MSEGTLYPILHALEQEGCLKSDWRTVDGRRRKYYHLTDKGRRQFAETQTPAARRFRQPHQLPHLREENITWQVDGTHP